MTTSPDKHQFSIRFFGLFVALVASYFAGWTSHRSYNAVRAHGQFQDNVEALNDLVNADLREELKKKIETLPEVKTCRLIDDPKKEQLVIVLKLAIPPLTPEMVRSISTIAKKGYNASLHRDFLVVDSLAELE